MALKQRLSIGQRQRLALTPEMRRSLALLRQPADMLRDEIAREAAENPFLVVEDAGPGPGGAAAGPGAASPYDVALETTAAPPEGLYTALARQIVALRLAPEVEAAALYLAGELREDAYLDTPLDDLARATGADPALLQSALTALQRCEPAGVGARDLAECLVLQLVDAEVPVGVARAAIARLGDFAEGRWGALARALGLPAPEVRRLAALIRGLSPSPVAADAAPATPRIPDLLVETDEGGRPHVSLNPAAFPRVTVMRIEGAEPGAAETRPWLARAEAMVRGLGARGETLLAVGRHIVAEQDAFFAEARAEIRPMSRADMAAALGIHPSTLGRAVAGKSLWFRGEAHDLARFFQRALPGPDGAISAFDAQRRILRLVAAEPPGQPLADAAIASQLKKEGVDIKRRTVAKYRKCLRIPSSYERRRRGASANAPHRSAPGERPSED